jgi:hypothetical protein
MGEARLIVLTGPSHSGKTEVGVRLRERLPPPVARLAMDELLASFTIEAEEYWRTGLAAGYDVLAAGADALLRRGFSVLVESTFTYIPLDGEPPEFHLEQVERLAEVAQAAGARFDLVVLSASRDELLRRRQATGRLWDEVIEGSARLHEEAAPRLGGRPLDTTSLDIEAATARAHGLLQPAATT